MGALHTVVEDGDRSVLRAYSLHSFIFVVSNLDLVLRDVT